MLAEKLTSTIENNLLGATTSAATAPASAIAPSAQFANEYTPVANLTTLDVKVSVGAQADIVAMFNYSSCGLSWDIGYNFWGRSCEKIHCPLSCNDPCNPYALTNPAQANTWALKGDARVYGFATNVSATPVALSATESNATIHTGTNLTSTTTNATLLNSGIDNPQFAYGVSPVAVRLVYEPGIADLAANHIQTSVDPVFLSACDIAFIETRGISHKVFTHLSYNFDRECWIPYLGVGGFAEFGSHCDSCNSNACSTTTSCATTCTTTTTCCTSNSCNNCLTCALSQWGIWIKGGISFN